MPKLQKTDDPTLRKCPDRRTDGGMDKDGQSLFHRTLRLLPGVSIRSASIVGFWKINKSQN